MLNLRIGKTLIAKQKLFPHKKYIIDTNIN